MIRLNQKQRVSAMLWCACLILASPFSALPQLKEPFFQHFSVEQGLSQSSVYAICQDSKGFLWFGTADGINKYDGYEFTTYRHSEYDTNSLSDNTVRAIIEDKNGNLWIAATDALNRYSMASGRFDKFLIPWGETIAEDNSGNIWVGNHKGILKVNPVSGEIFPFQYPSNHNDKGDHVHTHTIARDRHGNLWIANGNDVDKLDPATGAIRCYGDVFQRSGIMKGIYVRGIAVENDTIVWVGSYNGPLLRLNTAAEEVRPFQTFPAETNKGKAFITSLFMVNDSSLFLVTNENGIVTFNTRTGTSRPIFSKTQYPDFFKTNNARCIIRDRSGIFWFGTDDDGVYKYDPRPPKFRHIKKEKDEPNSLSGNFLRAIFEDRKERVWIGTYEQGLTLWDKNVNQFTHYLTSVQPGKDEPAGISVNAICMDSSQTMWVGSSQGLLKYNEKNNQFIRVMPSSFYGSPEIKTMRCSRSGLIWLSTSTELFSFRPETGIFENMEFTPLRYPGIKSASVRCMYEDSLGVLWFGTYNGGISKFDPAKRTCKTLTYQKNNANSLSHDIVNVIVPGERDILWIGTEHGLNKFDPVSETFTRYFEEDGLPSAFIYEILVDEQKNLWISTNKGITRFDPFAHTFRNYGIEDGLQSSEFNRGPVFRNAKGEMYFGGINGFNVLHPDSVTDNPHIPQIVITGIKKLDLPVEMKGEVSELSSLTLQYGEDIFSVRFAALEYSNPSKNQYAYMLEGFEDNWIYCGAKREIRYTHLDPGSYVFHVKGSNNDGVWNTKGISFAIIVVPPFWKTWWFLSIAGIGAIGLVGGTIRYIELRKVRRHLENLERERAMDRERARISQDMHDEIGATLTKIAIMSEIARRDKNNSEAMEQHLQKISNNARDVVDSISEIIWAINPKNDRLDNLISFIREYASGFFEGTQIHCSFDIPEPVPEYVFSGEQRRNILLVVKEALNNIVKHSQAGNVNIGLTTTNNQVMLSIHDDGKGFAAESLHEFGNGLFNMRKRMETINGSFDIVSSKEQGTTITISLNG